MRFIIVQRREKSPLCGRQTINEAKDVLDEREGYKQRLKDVSTYLYWLVSTWPLRTDGSR